MSEYSNALAKLKEFNRFISTHPTLSQDFVLGKWNFLQAYQSEMFSDIRVKLEKTNTTHGGEALNKISLAIRFRQVAALGVSLVSYLYLVLSRKTVLIYTADKNTAPDYVCDFRMLNLYQFLYKNDVRFFEIFHTVFNESFFKRLFTRRRPAIYLESLDIVYKLISKTPQRLLSFQELESLKENKELFAFLVSKYHQKIGASLFRIKLLKGILFFTNSKHLLATSDTRNYNELVAACNLNSIETFGYQGGNISKYNVGYLDCCELTGRVMKPKKFIVESNYWKNELLRLGTYFSREEIEIGGNLKEDYLFEDVESDGPKDENKVVILIPYEIAAPKEEILKYIESFIKYPSIKVVFKLRADRNVEEQAREYGLSHTHNNLTLVTSLDEVDNFDIVAGTYSTFLYEMIGKLKPVILLKTSLDYGEGLVINELAEELGLEDLDIYEKIKSIQKTSADLLKERRRKLYDGYVLLVDGLSKIFYR